MPPSLSKTARLFAACSAAFILITATPPSAHAFSPQTVSAPCHIFEASVRCDDQRGGGGGGGGGGRDGGGDRGGGGGGGGGYHPQPERGPFDDLPPGLECDYDGPCGYTPEIPDGPPPDDGGGEYVAPPVPSESDFASFPIPPSDPYALPVDWTVTGKPTAFWADAGVKEFDAELLGFPLRVRATPIEYHWDFGDGNATSSPSPGAEPRRPELGTITHTYSDKGERTVTLTTVYTGEYNYGSGWNDIAGTAAVESDGLPMTVYRYHKYRVEDDCTENPYGSDCAPN